MPSIHTMHSKAFKTTARYVWRYVDTKNREEDKNAICSLLGRARTMQKT